MSSTTWMVMYSKIGGVNKTKEFKTEKAMMDWIAKLDTDTYEVQAISYPCQ